MPTLARQSDRNRDARQRGELALLAAAEALVLEGESFAEVSVAAIAKQAGFSRATFYAYFTDKRALALRLGSGLASVLEADASPWLKDRVGSVRGTLTMILEVFEAHAGAVQLLTEAATYDPEVAALWRDVHRRFQLATQARLIEDNPTMKEPVAAARAFVLVWGTEGSFTEYLRAPGGDRDALLDALALLWGSAFRD